MNFEERLKQLRPRPAPAWNPGVRRRGNVVVFVAAAAALLVSILIAVTRGPAPAVDPTVRREPLQERKRAEEAVETLRQKEEAVIRERPVPEADPEEARLREWEEKLRRLQAERAQAERELAEAREREKRIEEKIEPTPPPPAPPRTESAFAFVDDGKGRRDLKAGSAVATTTGSALVTFPDGMKVTLAAATDIEIVGTNHLSVLRGTIDAVVARQSKDRPALLRSPHGVASSLESSLRLIVSRDATQLEVMEGSARLSRDGKSIDVKAGYGAAATPGRALASQPLPKEDVLVSLDFADSKNYTGIGEGSLEQGPGKVRALAGLNQDGVTKMQISDAAKGLFTVRGDETITFDYWVEARATKVNLNVRNRTQGRSHEFVLPKFTRGKWTRVSIPIAEFGEAGTRAKSGDLIINVYLQAVGDAEFYIDNFQITRPRALKKGK